MEGITSDLLSKIDNKNKKLVTKENIIESILKVLPRNCDHWRW
jgi:hypothetical protein